MVRRDALPEVRPCDPRQANAYDDFAEVYDRHWGPTSLQLYPAYRQHVFSELGIGSSVLDVCCGTGVFLRELRAEGHSVMGVDASQGMLRCAARNVPDVQLLHADASDFLIDREFDSVVCVFDSLNHITEEKKLIDAMSRMYYHARNGGLCAFDMNMERKYVCGWNNRFMVTGNGYRCEVETSTDIEKRIAYFLATTTFTDERGRVDVALCQTWYDREKIEELIADVGFPHHRCHLMDGESIEAPERLLFVCRKE
jgi:ubiquinone/menaquinone biosynthesis C-methylase UbiE